MKVLILADQPGWIIDRITDVMIEKMDCDFTKRYFGNIDKDELVELAWNHDLVHFQNVVDTIHPDILRMISTPKLMSIRSHRYNKGVMATLGNSIDHLHVVNPYLVQEFPNAFYIPDGIMDEFMAKKEFTVGFAGHPDHYKGYDLIKQACEEEGVKFKPATNLGPHQMLDYYKSIDLYVCASINEGHSTPVMECLAMNVPVITTDVGIPRALNVHKIDRSVAGIRHGIQRYNSRSQVNGFTWYDICRRFKSLYEDLV